eukprot:evm.model.scf_54.1 EVM.evm.TU.scf_54.1   scf_54:2044-3150(+)
MKPKFLDWRFEVRRDRKKRTYKTRSWYAAPERWIDDSDPTGVTPVELVKKLTETKVTKPEKNIVLIDDDNPQTHCAISGDPLEKYFDNELEDWYYKDCRRVYGEEAKLNHVHEGAICITSCIEKPDTRKDLLGILHTPVDDVLQSQMLSKDMMSVSEGSDLVRRPSGGTKRKCGDSLFAEQFNEKKVKEEPA